MAALTIRAFLGAQRAHHVSAPCCSSTSVRRFTASAVPQLFQWIFAFSTTCAEQSSPATCRPS
eukprot:804356-Alexandrium_andersonii.AAC.1